MRRALAAAAALLLLGTQSALAATPYEPNDSGPAAAGPLLAAQFYEAAIETASDRDFFFLFVTSDGAQVALTVQSLGGGTSPSDIDANVLDASGTPLGGQAFIGDGESRSLGFSLAPGKYYVEVSTGEGFGDSYRLSASTSRGAIGPYSQIEGRCASAEAATRRAEKGLSRSRSRLQRATARLRRSRYAPPEARRRAQAAHHEALARVRDARRKLASARESREPWCFIAQ